MATRPVFFASTLKSGQPTTQEIQIHFEWHPGFSVAQKQRSIASLHSGIINQTGLKNPLEISSKSANPLGIELSAFNLQLGFRLGPTVEASVETIYQGSKEFENQKRDDGDRYFLSPREARRRAREYELSHELSGWTIGDYHFDLSSGTEFYDWLYLGALYQQQDLLCRLVKHDCFTDIEFNPKRSLACQARSAALARSISLVEGSLLPYLKRISAFRQCLRQNSMSCKEEEDAANQELGMQLALGL